MFLTLSWKYFPTENTKAFEMLSLLLCFSSSMACGAIRIARKGLLAHRKSGNLFHAILKNSQDLSYSQQSVTFTNAKKTMQFKSLDNAQGCEKTMSTLSILTLFFMTPVILNKSRNIYQSDFFSVEEDRRTESNRRWSEMEED